MAMAAASAEESGQGHVSTKKIDVDPSEFPMLLKQYYDRFAPPCQINHHRPCTDALTQTRRYAQRANDRLIEWHPLPACCRIVMYPALNRIRLTNVL